MNPISNILEKFEPISLTQMDKVKLMDRQETKYAFPTTLFPKILAQLSEYYFVLEVNGVRNSAYTSLYYDSDNFLLYHQHHNGKKNRYKIRHRVYLESGIGFFEVKLKNAKGRTIKNRFQIMPEDAEYAKDSAAFLLKHTPINPNELKPVVNIQYHRMTLVSKTSLERLTIDTDLHFGIGHHHTTIPKLVIAEVKQEGKSPSAFIQLMKEYKIRPGSLSKYCMAVGLTHTQVKTNRFKPHFNRLKNYYDSL